jgi:hypothetical protein
MLYREITAVYSENHMKHTNVLWAESKNFNVKPGGTHSELQALKG